MHDRWRSRLGRWRRWLSGRYVMSIIIQLFDEEHGTATHATLRHGDHEFNVLIHGKKIDLLPLLGKSMRTEVSFDRIVSWTRLNDFDDDQSCIKSSNEFVGAHTLRGRVHNVIEIESNKSIVDLYLQTGPEFLAISSEELGSQMVPVGTALEITVYGLRFHPTCAS